jgi:acetyl-CoA decarbonylase/synthase complex subunit gamma
VAGLPRLDQPFVIGSLATPAGQVPQVSSSWTNADYLGTFKARWGIGRMHYTVDPGLYALGPPDEKSPVLVTANYKMSFDRLRKALPGRNAWILALDTKGINVWCAAGKGTFGTEELVARIGSNGLEKIVSHREVILPQLSAPGVAAHQLRKLSGFKGVFGPIRAEDLPAFLDNGMKATEKMRSKAFTTWERFVLIPVELVGALKAALVIIPILLILSGLLGPSGFWPSVLNQGLFAVQALLTAIFAGAVLTPLLLPWLPGRAFSLKSLAPGLLCALLLVLLRWGDGVKLGGLLEMIAWVLVILSAAAYLAMNFTGASTYTSLSGVKKEMRWSLPFQIGGGVAGVVLWVCSMLLDHGV